MTKSRPGTWRKLSRSEQDSPGLPIECQLCGSEFTWKKPRKAIMRHLENAHSITNVRERSKLADMAMLVWERKR